MRNGKIRESFCRLMIAGGLGVLLGAVGCGKGDDAGNEPFVTVTVTPVQEAVDTKEPEDNGQDAAQEITKEPEDNGQDAAQEITKQPDNKNETDYEWEVSEMKNYRAFEMGQVEQKDAYCVNGLELEIAYLLSFDVDKLLAGFRENAGLDKKGATVYGGWEDMLIGGHSVGHYLSALALAYSNPGVSDEDREEVYAMLTQLIDGMLECQENSKGKPGFLFAAKLVDRANVEKQFDNVEQGKANIMTEAWVPWYTMHKILAGIVDVYEQTGYENALTLAKGLGDWVYERSASWSAATRNTVLSIEYGGMNDVLYELYAVTGDDRYAVAAHLFDEDALFTKVRAGGKNALNNRHANTTIPKFLGALNRYVTTNGKEINGKVVDASAYLEYAKAFWTTVTEHHTYITGANSEWEHFGQDDILDAERTNCNNETCNVYNMLKLSRRLYEITGDKKYADYYENAFYNSILSSQNPETGMTTYFQPMATGYFKVYSTPFTKFWCCTGTGMENFVKLNDSIYFHKDNAVYVNLYFSSVLTWSEKNLQLTQSADFPESDVAEFVIHTIDGAEKQSLDLYLRIPEWIAKEPVVTVNGQAYQAETEDGYAHVAGEFADGTVVTIELPMKVEAYALPDNESAIGFKYGPVVLSADLGREDMATTMTGVIVTIPAHRLVDNEILKLPQGVSREAFMENIDEYLIPVAGEKTKFCLRGIEGADFVFTPHYLRYQERYGIYWYFKTEEEIAEEEAKKIRVKTETIDTVQPGYGQYENDELHAMQEQASVSVTNDGTYRYAKENGFFTYRMAVKPDGRNYLSVLLRAEDNGKSLRIASGDIVLFEDVLDYIGLEKTYELRIAIPDPLVAASEKVRANGEDYRVISLTFSGIDGAASARVCDFIYMYDVETMYPVDEKLAYFVDCGDYDPTTVSEGDSFGVYNSVTEQLYGYDAVTGKKWGLIDEAFDRFEGGKSKRGGLYTSHTWCFEFNERDGVEKKASNRYTKNQYEEGIKERYLDYAFELPNGIYRVEIGFANPWSCSNHPTVFANLGRDGESLLAEAFEVSGSPLTAKTEVKDGKLTLHFRNATPEGLAINVSYIKVFFLDE